MFSDPKRIRNLLGVSYGDCIDFRERQGEIFIADSVLVELEWVLISIYSFRREQVVQVIESLLKTRQFAFRKSDLIKAALEKYRHMNKDFSDCLIGELGQEFHVKTYTFDGELKRDNSFVVL